jgi:hypothetical protein
MINVDLIVSPDLIRMREVIYNRGDDDLTDHDKTEIFSIAESLLERHRLTIEVKS